MSYIEQVQRGLDFVESHLDADIELADVARHAGLSQWHFQRIFKASTNETLKTYIRSRRLANALHKLLHSKRRILDIAVEAGYETHESFTRAFKASYGMTPKDYRQLGDKSLFLNKVAFNEEYLRHLNQGVSLEPTFIEQRPIRLVGLRTLYYGVDSEKNNIANTLPKLWDDFLARLDEISERIPGTCYGVIQQAEESSDILEYHAAIEVTKTIDVPDGMHEILIPSANYAVFDHLGKPQLLDSTVNYIYSSWLLSSQKRHSRGPDLEYYGDGFIPDSEHSLMQYAIPLA